MKTTLLTIVLATATTCLRAQVDVNAGLRMSEGGSKDFHLAIGSHFGVEGRAVVALRKDVPDSELPVVFHLAGKAKVSPAAIVALRREKKTWMDITLHFGLSPEVFHVPVAKMPGPPYGRAYGYFKNKPKSGWGAIKLNDKEIVHLVNVKFLSNHHSRSPDEVLRIKGGSGGFVKLHGELKRNGNPKVRSSKQRVEKPRPSAAQKAKNHRGKGRGRNKKR